MPRFTKIVLWVYVAFNLLIAVTLIASPGQVDATYKGGDMTPTRQFMWFSIGSFHLFVVGVTLVSLRLRHAAERRWLHLANGAFYVWDAVTQWLYWGKHLGVAARDLHTNAGVSAVCGLLLVVAFWRDRDVSAAAPGTDG